MAAWAVLGPRMQGVHESQDSLEVLWCCFPRVGNPGLGVAGVIALGCPEGLRRTVTIGELLPLSFGPENLPP